MRYKVNDQVIDNRKIQRQSRQGLKVDRHNDRVIVEGVNVQTRHKKPAVPQNRAVLKSEGAIHASNVMLYDAKTRSRQVGIKTTDGGKRVRFP